MEDVDTLYARWLAGEITPEEEKSLKESGEWEELEAIVKAMEGLNLPDFDAQVAYAQLLYKQKEELVARTSRRYVWLGALAAAACIALLLYFSWNSSGNLVKFSAEMAENTRANLPDGSRFVLNDGSSLQYLETNWQNQRVLTLQGEALFLVTTGNTFQVITPNGKVEVVGTQFNVRAWGKALAVECYEGKVSVSHGQEQALIEMGQAIRIENGEMGEVESIEHRTPFWTLDFSKFDKEALDQVFDELGRQYAIQIQKPLLNRNFSGSFSHSNLEEALEQVCKPMGLRYSISVDRQIVTILE